MKHLRSIILSAILPGTMTLFASVAHAGDQATSINPKQDFTFTKNMGQWPDSILFRADANGAVMWFTKTGVHQQFFKRTEEYTVKASEFVVPDKFSQDRDNIETMLIKTSFVGSNPDVQIETGELQHHRCNYYFGNDPTKWVTDAPNYGSVTYKNIYQGVDLRYYGNGKRMEYDFIVSPGADPMAIKLRYDNVESVTYADNGDLIVKTKWNDVVEQAPIVYTQENGKAELIAAQFVINMDNTFTFAVDDSYDKSKTLILDPVLVYGTFLGGAGDDQIYDMASEADNTYVTGRTYSANFPIFDEFDNSLSGTADAFVTRILPSGTTLDYSSYLGGSQYEAGTAITVDQSEVVYVAGITNFTDFPTNLPYDNSHNGSDDGFVVKLGQEGNLIYGTYLGGTLVDQPSDIAVDNTGKWYVVGLTSSTNFPYFEGYDNDLTGSHDCFITKFLNGTTLDFSSYLGGSGADVPFSIALNGDDPYIVGYTQSSNFPTLNAYDNTLGGSQDVFVTQFDDAGDGLMYSTFLGGSSFDTGIGIEVDATGYAYVVGTTQSSNFPTLNAYDNTLAGIDAFAAKLKPNGDSLVYSTFIGGSTTEYCNDVVIDSDGTAYIVGYTVSSDFPLLYPCDSTFEGTYEVYVVHLNSVGNTLLYSTFLGGTSNEQGEAIALGDTTGVCVAGHTFSTNFPINNAYDATHNGGGNDGFIARLMDDQDGDGIPDISDNCPTVPNPGQEDTDLDNIGNVCDPTFVIDTVNTDDIFFIAKGDFDRDNYVDYVTSGFVSVSDGRLSIIYGDPVTLLETPQELVSLTNVAIDVDYVNADTLLDIIARSSSKVYLVRNLGNRSYAIDSFAVASPEFPGPDEEPNDLFSSSGSLTTESVPLIGKLPRYPYVQSVIGIDHYGQRTAHKANVMPPSDVAVVSGYFNSDVQSDLVVSPNKLLFGTGTGGFGAPTTLPFSFDQVDAADVDNDGDEDLALTVGSLFKVYLNNGSGTFTQSFSTAAAIRTFDYSTVHTKIDLNGDRKPDFGIVTGTVASATDTGTIRVFLGNGLGGVLDSSTFILNGGGSFFTLDFVDYDGDQDLDLTTVDADANSLIVLLNDGFGNFTQGEVTNVTTGSLETFAIAGGDLDRDGNTDYVAGGESGSPVVTVINQLPDQPISDSEMTVTALNNYSISITNPNGLTISPYEQTVAGSEYRPVDFDNDDTLDTRTFDYNLQYGEYLLVFDRNVGPGPIGGKLTATIGINGSQQYRLAQEYDAATKDANATDTVTFYYQFEPVSSIAPVNGLKTQSVQPAFQWKGLIDSVGVTKYHFQLDEYHDLRGPRFEDSTPTTRQFLAPSALGVDSVYYWRVRSQSGGIWSGWSRTFAAYIGPGCCVGVRGDASNNGAVNVLDLNYLVAFFFSGGPAPACSNEANVNGSGPLNILDLNYLVAYFFSGGPAPTPCP